MYNKDLSLNKIKFQDGQLTRLNKELSDKLTAIRNSVLFMLVNQAGANPNESLAEALGKFSTLQAGSRMWNVTNQLAGALTSFDPHLGEPARDLEAEYKELRAMLAEVEALRYQVPSNTLETVQEVIGAESGTQTNGNHQPQEEKKEPEQVVSGKTPRLPSNIDKGKLERHPTPDSDTNSD